MAQPLFNVNDGPNGRDGGPYLDQVQQRDAEIARAAAEGREPDFENMVSSPGVQLVTAEQLVKMHHMQPSEQDKPLLDATAVLANVDNPDVGANPVGMTVEEEETEVEEEEVASTSDESVNFFE